MTNLKRLIKTFSCNYTTFIPFLGRMRSCEALRLKLSFYSAIPWLFYDSARGAVRWVLEAGVLVEKS
jgi:hypothetical protein